MSILTSPSARIRNMREDIHVVNDRPPGVGPDRPAEHPDGCGLARAVGAQKARNGAPGDLELNRIRCDDSAEALGEAVCDDHMFSRRDIMGSATNRSASCDIVVQTRHAILRRPPQLSSKAGWPGRWQGSIRTGHGPECRNLRRLVHRGFHAQWATYNQPACLTNRDTTIS